MLRGRRVERFSQPYSREGGGRMAKKGGKKKGGKKRQNPFQEAVPLIASCIPHGESPQLVSWILHAVPHPDASDHVPLRDPIDHVHAGHDSSEDRVARIEVWLRAVRDEELTP